MSLKDADRIVNSADPVITKASFNEFQSGTFLLINLSHENIACWSKVQQKK